MGRKRGRADGDEAGRYAYDGLERIFHEKARLGILTSLVSSPDGLVFSRLKELCSLTDGNLSRHLHALREAGLVEVWKGYRDNRPQTLCRLTPGGRREFLDYIGQLERVVTDALEASEKKTPRRRRLGGGWSPA